MIKNVQSFKSRVRNYSQNRSKSSTNYSELDVWEVSRKSFIFKF